MTDRTHPDSGRIITSSDILLHDAETALLYEELRAAIDDGHESMTHADALAEIAAIRAENVELRAQLEAVGAGGVQALSAAPVGWKLVPVEPTDEMLKAADDGDDEYTLRNFGPGVQRVMQGPYDHYCAMLAASPTPPAEQPTPDTGHAEADRLIGRLMSSDPDFEDCRQAAVLIQREIKGPDGFGTWREAAIAERLARVNKQAAPKAAPGEPFQHRVQPWLLQCFGAEIAADTVERNHRFLEEALELVQSTGCTQSEAHQLVDYVFGRPVGEPAQEVGGVMVTLAALCLANGLDMHNAGEIELARIWTKVEAIRAKQAAKPKHSPLPQAAPQQEAQEPAHPSCKSDMTVNGGALKLALNVLRRAGKTEVADELEKTAQPAPAPLSDDAKDAARLDWLALAGPTSICVVIDRPHDGEVEVSTDDVTGYGKTLREALDAARKQGGA